MSEYHRIHVQLNLDKSTHLVVHQFLESIEKQGRSEWVRQTLYGAISGQTNTDPVLQQILDVVQRIENNGGVQRDYTTVNEAEVENVELLRNLRDSLQGWDN